MRACIPNIGPRQRRRRLVFGLVALAVAAALGAGLAGTSLSLRWVVSLPLYAAAIGFLQYREKT